MKKLLVTMGLVLLATQSNAKTTSSYYRPNVKVDFIYNQQLDEPYSTDWYAKLESKNKTKRVVYIETVGKFVNKGFMSFDCANPSSGVDVKLYNWEDFGNESNLTKVTVLPKDFKAWQNDQFEPLNIQYPPYEVYKRIRNKYCKA